MDTEATSSRLETMKDDLRVRTTTEGHPEPGNPSVVDHLEAVLQKLKKRWALVKVVLVIGSFISAGVGYYFTIVFEERIARIRMEEKLNEIERIQKDKADSLLQAHESDQEDLRRELEQLRQEMKHTHLRLVLEVCQAIKGNYQWDSDSRSAVCSRDSEFHISIEIP